MDPTPTCPKIHRYNRCQSPDSALDPLEDIYEWLTYLKSEDYLKNILTKHHKLSIQDAKKRAQLIHPYIRDAIALIQQSKDSPPEVSFLPVYYALLNLAKVRILVGPHYASLPSHRWHGATYDVFGKDSHSITTECITLKRGGALALYYQTLMGKAWPIDRKVCLGDIYPYLADVGQEYLMATGRDTRILKVTLSILPTTSTKKGRVSVICNHSRTKYGNLLKKVPGCKGLVPDPHNPSQWLSVKSVKLGTSWQSVFDKFFDRTFVYHDSFDGIRFPYGYGRFPMPEELPIILAFFHLSSVARYKPDFLYQVVDSDFWPVLSTARRHCLYKFLLLFWSSLHQTSFFIKRG